MIATKNLVKQEQAPSFRIIGTVFRVIFGAVFVFSGFVKTIDPLGTTYKMSDYLQAMNLPQPYCLILICSMLMIAAEFTIGLSLISGIKLKFFSWCALIFMLVMTPITLWLAVSNPVSDCGCFGDALVIGNWATFWKNIGLLILIIVILYCEKYHRQYLSPLPSWLVAASFFVFSVCISLYCLKHLPLIDFRPYKIGNNIPELMKIPDNASTAEYRTTFTYENKNNGEQHEFHSLNDAPWNDTINWKFISQNPVLIKKGFEPKIHDFVIESPEYGDITEEIFEDENFVFLFVMYDLSKTNTDKIEHLNDLYTNLSKKGIHVYALSASLNNEIEQFRQENNTEFEFCSTDPVALKTMIRANPGVVVLKQGTVIDKWNAVDTKKAFAKFCKKNNF
ncbi:MAG: DoxX family protein [Prevotellaceae bacterium]|jgi:uncharacterized membrane protein YphA (DoxX/SURF4 family)/peroxiredoxin|nr:DoxX family protein [Prevotellaceae bacterium]